MKVIGLNFINADKKLEAEFYSRLEKAKASYSSIQAAQICLVLKSGQVIVHHKLEVFDLKSDMIFVRGRGPYAHMTSLIMCIVRFLGIKTIGSSSAGEFTHNDGKINQMLHFALNKLPIPETIIFVKSAFEFVPFISKKYDYNFPLVLKKTGSKGNSVWKVNNFAEVEEIVSKEKKHEVFLLQEFVPNSFDIRALFFQRQFIGAMKRSSCDGFYNNVSKGALVEKIELTDEERELSLRACSITNQDFAGVDIVRSNRGPLFFEVNNRPAYEGFEEATGISVGEKMAEIILEKN